MNLLEASIESIQQAMNSGSLTAVQLTQYYLDRIAAYDQQGPGLNSIRVLNDDALKQAAALDDERSRQGARSMLHGIPILVKDNYETKGMPTTVGSVLFKGFAPDRDAHLVSKLKNAGALLLGKTNMQEFAYGITNVGSIHGFTRNPYDPTRNPGGSSGGTGAAVAANFAVTGLGSDTCGSIRIPAAQNNLVGLRGTQGMMSRQGIFPLSSTQDIGGPLTKSVRDLAIMLDQMIGYDAEDAQTAESFGHNFQFLANLQLHEKVRIGLLREWMEREEGDEVVARVIREALTAMSEKAGWEIVELESAELEASLDRPLEGYFVSAYDFKQDVNAYLRANPEMGFRDLEELLALGKHHPKVDLRTQKSMAMRSEDEATYYQEMAQRKVVRRALLRLLAENNLDALAYPSIRHVAALIGEDQMGTNCRLAACSGVPAISVPAGFYGELPVGLELLAEPWADQKLLDLAYTVETRYPQRKIPGSTP
ncbi:MAG: amidase family protein [SAR324 cluster bacterium]|nr:amidase family protein [SAR324 cluster bacterium]